MKKLLFVLMLATVGNTLAAPASKTTRNTGTVSIISESERKKKTSIGIDKFFLLLSEIACPRKEVNPISLICFIILSIKLGYST